MTATLGRKGVIARIPVVLTPLAAGIAGLVFVGGSGREAASGGICDNPGPPPAMASVPGLRPGDAPPPLPSNGVQLPAYNPARGDPEPALPPGWIWSKNRPEPTDGRGVAIMNVARDGTTAITLISNGGLWTWKDPGRPTDVPWYNPAQDLCR